MEAEKKDISDNRDIKHKKKSLLDEWHWVTMLLMLYDLFADLTAISAKYLTFI